MALFNVCAYIAKSLNEFDIKTGKKQNHVRYFKAVVLEDHKAEGVNEMIRKNIEESSVVLTDKSTSYADISDTYL